MSPVFILASPRSYTSLICTMLGQHPSLYGAPELNLFAEETLADFLVRARNQRQFILHGLLRMVAQLYAGEQTLNSLDMARRWLLARIDRSTTEIYRELEQRVAPLGIVDKSPLYVSSPDILERVWRAYPDAHFIHLVRHPLTQGDSLLRYGGGMMARMMDTWDTSVKPPVLDPQIAWGVQQRQILDFLDKVPQNRKCAVRAEDVLTDPKTQLSKLADWLGVGADEAAVFAMMRPENSPYAHPGPFGANMGNSMDFLESPQFRGGEKRTTALMDALPWRKDGKTFTVEVRELAQHFGYQ